MAQERVSLYFSLTKSDHRKLAAVVNRLAAKNRTEALRRMVDICHALQPPHGHRWPPDAAALKLAAGILNLAHTHAEIGELIRVSLYLKANQPEQYQIDANAALEWIQKRPEDDT